MSPFVKAVWEANRSIDRALKRFDPKWYEPKGEGAGGDISSGLDLFAESVFVSYLKGFGTIESEESGIIGEGEWHIILDPLDGSANALSHFPYFGTSVALIDPDGLLREAVVCNLATQEIFVRAECGSRLKGDLRSDTLKPITPQLKQAQVGLFEKAYARPKIVSMLDRAGLKFRAPGAVALSLAYAHRVRYVLYVGAFRIYDFSAGLALCEGMEVCVEPGYVIVTHDKQTLETIKTIVEDAIEGEADVF